MLPLLCRSKQSPQQALLNQQKRKKEWRPKKPQKKKVKRKTLPLGGGTWWPRLLRFSIL
jgi:hypothetical protein